MYAKPTIVFKIKVSTEMKVAKRDHQNAERQGRKKSSLWEKEDTDARKIDVNNK